MYLKHINDSILVPYSSYGSVVGPCNGKYKNLNPYISFNMLSILNSIPMAKKKFKRWIER